MISPTRRTHQPVPESLGKIPDATLPLYLALAWLVIRVTPATEHGATLYSAPFVAAILEIVAREAFEVNPTPTTFTQLKTETDRLLRKESAILSRSIGKRRARGQHVPPEVVQAASEDSWMDEFPNNFDDVTTGCSFIDTIERDIRARLSEEGDDQLESVEPIERRSPLGLVFRRVLIKLRKLAFDETAVLSVQVAEWCGATIPESSTRSLGFQLTRSAAMEQPPDMKNLSMSSYETAMASGDFGAALVSLRRFYDSLKPENGRSFHQHALMNLAAFHYMTGGIESAEEALGEAIRHARTEGDNGCLDYCLSLQYRLALETEASAWPGSAVPSVDPNPLPLRRLPKAHSAKDEIWAIRAAVDMGEPVHVAFRRVYTAMGPSASAQELKGPTWHVAQAGLWAMLGSDLLAEMHETMALRSPELNDEIRMQVLLLRAERAAKKGHCEEALTMLLDGDTIDDLKFHEYQAWARSVWAVLEREADLHRDGDALAVINGLRSDPAYAYRLGPGGPIRELFDLASRETAPTRGIIFAHDQVTDALRTARAMLDARNPPHLVLPHVLSALHLAVGLGVWPLYQVGAVALAETLLAMGSDGMAIKAEAEVTKVWTPITHGGDNELFARAALVRAKAHTAMFLDAEEKGDAELGNTVLEKAVHYVDLAVARAGAIGARRLKNEACGLRAMLAELRGESVDAASWDESNGKGAAPALSERVRRVGEIVRLVGVRVAEGWK